MRHFQVVSFVLTLVAAGLVASSSNAQVLFTTQEDFANWTAPDLVLGGAADLDGSTTGGVATNGAPGTAGALSVGDTKDVTNYSFAYSSDLLENQAAFDALGTEGIIAIDFVPPTDGTYFQVGIVLNYDNNFSQFFGGSIDNGDGSRTALVPYQFTPGDAVSYFQIGIIHNSNANENYTVDNLRIFELPADGPSIFTTQEDFAGWGSNDLLLSVVSMDLDDSTTGGLATGGVDGTGGSLQAGDSLSAFTYAFSSELFGNVDLIDALGSGGTIAFDHTMPSDGSYFQLGIVLNYDNHFDQFFGTTFENGSGSFTTYVDFDFVPEDLSSFFQIGFIHNSDSFDLYLVDNFRLVADEILIGDVNCDGLISLLDVAPFVEAITSGVYDVKADVNEDGVVDLLDVGPFVDLLTAG